MALVITSVQAYGVESDEPLTKKFKQYLILTGTGANTDATYDLSAVTSGSLGTFWTAATGAGSAAALKAFRDIATKALSFVGVTGIGISNKSKAGSSPVVLAGTIAGGAAATAAVVTGLLTTDVILAVTQTVKGANSLPLLGYATQIADGLTVTYSADPGANGTIKVAVVRSGGAAAAGTYTQTVQTNLLPDLAFKSGDAPTAFTLIFEWELQNNVSPVRVTSP